MIVSTNVPVGADFLGHRTEAVIGRGGMGVVYRAYDLRLKRTVALKLMAPELALDERFRERFARESELAMSLEHPNVVPIYDAGEFDGRLYLAMRHVEGSDLRELLRRERALDGGQAVAICRQVAEALDAAHAKGLVHRDVKPSNVLLDEGGHVYLADFGLTRRLSQQGVAFGDSHSLGTPAYLAPEQIEGRPVDGRADVYSLGCLLYECLTGRPPFPGDSRLAVVWAHLEEEPPNASECDRRLPAALDGVIRKALAKEPKDRYSICSELVAAAEEALGVGGREAGGRRTAILCAVFVVLVALAALGAVLMAREDGEAARSGLAAGENTLVRIDPTTNAIASVIDVGRAPAAAAAGGTSVWVYNRDDNTLSEIDTATGDVRHTTNIGTEWHSTDPALGPWLAADAGGAWFIGFDFESVRYRLSRVRADGQGRHEFRLDGEPRAVVVANGSAWVLVRTLRRNSVLRIQPLTGSVTARIRLPADSAGAVDGLAVGAGAVWATESRSAILHRVDLATGTTRSRDLGSWSTAPAAGFGWGWICSDHRMLRIDPRTLRSTLSRNALPAEDGRFAVGYNALWRHDLPSGALMRFDVRTGDPAGIIPVITKTVEHRGLTVTSITAGSGSVWATVSKG